MASALTTLLIFVGLSIVIPEKGSFPVEPSERIVQRPYIPTNYCNLAIHISDQLDQELLGTMRSCSLDSDCISVIHPMACRITIAQEHKDKFDHFSALIRENEVKAGSRCGPVYRCIKSYSSDSFVCVDNRCEVKRGKPIDLWHSEIPATPPRPLDTAGPSGDF